MTSIHKSAKIEVDAVKESGAAKAKSWTKPKVETLPRLNELTLQSPIPGGGGTGGGGSTVIP